MRVHLAVISVTVRSAVPDSNLGRDVSTAQDRLSVDFYFARHGRSLGTENALDLPAYFLM